MMPNVSLSNSKKSLQVYYDKRQRSSLRFATAFARGCNGKVATDYQFGRWAGFGSPRYWGDLNTTRNAGLDWYYGDHAYIGRGRYFRVTKNAFQKAVIDDGSVWNTRENVKRLEKLNISIQPWQKDGKYILVCPPNCGIAYLHEIDAEKWTKKVCKMIALNTDRPIRIRERKSKIPLIEALKESWMVVTAFSNVAVDAILAGKPVYCTHPCGATPVMTKSLKQIETPEYPDNRGEWLLNLMANQWTLSEMRKGMCWRAIEK